MMATASALRCQVITPEAAVLDTAASAVVLTAHDGEIGILPGRAPLLCKLGIGELRITTIGGTERLFIDGGFAHVLDNVVVVLTQQALRVGDIDVAAVREQLAALGAQKTSDPEESQRRAQEIKRARTKVKLTEIR